MEDLAALRKLEEPEPPAEPAKVVDREGQALVPGFMEAAAETPEITEGRLPGEMFTPEAEAIRKREGPPPAAPVQAELATAVDLAPELAYPKELREELVKLPVADRRTTIGVIERELRLAQEQEDARAAGDQGRVIELDQEMAELRGGIPENFSAFGRRAMATHIGDAVKRAPEPTRPKPRPARARTEAPLPAPRKLKEVALTDEQADHLDRWFKARKMKEGEARAGITRDRIFGSMQVAKGALRNLVGATSDYDAAKKLRPGPGTTQAEIQRRKRIARIDRDTYKGVYATALETLKAEVEKIGGTPGHFRRLQQIVEDRVPVREKKAPPLVLPSTSKTIDAMEQYGYLDDVNAETLPERVAAYRDEVPLADADVNREIEKIVIALKARDRVGKTTKTEWRDALAEGAPGLSSATVKAAVEQGPINPDGTLNKNFDKIMVAMRRKLREQRALEEAMSEDGSTRYTEAYDVAAVDAIATELAARGEEGDYGDPPWSIMDPDSGRPATAADIQGAIEARQGRLYARVLQKHARDMEDADVPFDIGTMDDPDAVGAPPPQTWEEALQRLPAPVRGQVRAIERLRRRQMGALRAGFEGPEPFTWRDYELQNMERLYAEAEARVAAPDAPGPLSREVEELTAALPRYESWKTWIRDNTDTIEKLFGNDARLFRVLLGVTSPATDVTVNVGLALKAHSQMRLGLPFEGFLPSVQQNLESVRLGRVIGGRKVRPYTRALVGFEDAVWVDRWIGRYFFGDQVKAGKVTAAQARKAAELMRQAADELGWSPREVSSALWAAGQIKAGLSPEEIGSYDRVLEERATAIRRFVDYFGPAAGESERLLNALVSVAEGEGDPGAGGHGVSRQVLQGAARQIRDIRVHAPAPEVLNHGARLMTGRLEDGNIKGRWLGTVLADHVVEKYHVRWSGLTIRNLNDLGIAAQVARNPAFETFHVVVTKGDKAILSLQHSSRMPGTSVIHAEGIIGLTRDLKMALAATGADGYYLVHNHPSGNPAPSSADLVSSSAISLAVPGFKGHVVTDHQTYTTIEPRDLARLGDLSRRQPTQEGVAAALQEVGARTPARVSQPAPDPVLRQGIDAADFWRSDKYKVRGINDFLRKMILSHRGPEGGVLGEIRQQSGQRAWPQLYFMDGESKVRAVLEVHPADYLDRMHFTGTIIEAGRQMGGHRVLGVISGLRDSRTHAATDEYLKTGILVDVLDPTDFGTGDFQTRGRDIPYKEVLAVEMGQPIMGEQPPPPWDPSRPPEPEAGGAGGAGAGGGRGGTPPPATPPPGSGPWPGDDGWDARAKYAEARARAHTGEWSPRDLWDALIMGARHFAKGIRDFAKWSGIMSPLAGIGRFLKRIWNVILSWFDERVVTRKGRVRDVDDTEAARRMEEGPRPIRPIPRVSKEDVRRVAERLRRPPPPPRPGEKPPEFPINLDWIRDEADVKELFRVFGEVLGEEAGRAKGYRSHKRVQEMANELGVSAEQLRRLFKKQGVLTDVQVQALRMLRQESAIQAQAKRQVYDDLAAQLADTQDPARRAALEQQLLEAERDYHAALHRAMGIWYTGIGAGSEAGRALAAHRIMTEWLSPEERAMRKLMRGLRATDEQAAALAEALAREDMAAIQRTYHEIMKPGLLRQFNEYFVNSILSGPATLGANVAGNAGHELLLRTPERGIAGMLDQLGVVGMIERLFGRAVTGKERSAAEMKVAAKALWKYRMGLPHALRYAKDATFKDTFTLVDKEFSVPTIPGVVGRTIRTPSRWMWALDRGAKVAAFGAERSVQVYRRAAREAKRMGWDSTQTKQRVKELDADVDRWMMLDQARKANPRSLSKDDRVWMLQNKDLGGMVQAMKDAALKSTFQDDVMPLTKMLVQARQQHPWMTPFVPFIRTPERILVGGLKRTPMGLAEALVQMKRGKIKGGDAADRLAQGVLGTMASIAVYMMAKEGHITGGGPTDWRERSVWLRTGRVPYGFRVPGTDRWYSIARMEPMATTWGFASDLAEAQDAKTAGDRWDKLHYSVLNNITNKTYLEGIISATEAVSDPERYGAQFSKRLLGALVPNLLASAARGIDPTIRQSDDIRSTLIARVPVFSTTLPARLSGTGEPLSREEDPISRFISPFRYRDEAGPERNLERLFLETGYIPSAPPKSMRLPGTRKEFMLSQQERDLYGAYGRRATLFARKLASDGDWSGLDVFQKEELLRRIYRFAQDASRKAIYASLYRRVWAGEAEEKPK
jgi:hypothetical protein